MGKQSEEEERGLRGLNFKFFSTWILTGEAIRRRSLVLLRFWLASVVGRKNGELWLIILSDYQKLTSFFSVISRLLAKDRRGRRPNGGRVVGVSKLCTITRKTINSLADCSSYFFLFACNHGYKLRLKWLTMTKSNNLDIVIIGGWNKIPTIYEAG